MLIFKSENRKWIAVCNKWNTNAISRPNILSGLHHKPDILAQPYHIPYLGNTSSMHRSIIYLKYVDRLLDRSARARACVYVYLHFFVVLYILFSRLWLTVLGREHQHYRQYYVMRSCINLWDTVWLGVSSTQDTECPYHFCRLCLLKKISKW